MHASAATGPGYGRILCRGVGQDWPHPVAGVRGGYIGIVFFFSDLFRMVEIGGRVVSETFREVCGVFVGGLDDVAQRA